MKRTKTELRNADKFLALIKAYKRGSDIQKKGRINPDWIDIDLGDYMDKTAVCYRVKPKGKR